MRGHVPPETLLCDVARFEAAMLAVGDRVDAGGTSSVTMHTRHDPGEWLFEGPPQAAPPDPFDVTVTAGPDYPNVQVIRCRGNCGAALWSHGARTSHPPGQTAIQRWQGEYSDVDATKGDRSTSSPSANERSWRSQSSSRGLCPCRTRSGHHTGRTITACWHASLDGVDPHLANDQLVGGERLVSFGALERPRLVAEDCGLEDRRPAPR